MPGRRKAIVLCASACAAAAMPWRVGAQGEDGDDAARLRRLLDASDEALLDRNPIWALYRGEFGNRETYTPAIRARIREVEEAHPGLSYGKLAPIFDADPVLGKIRERWTAQAIADVHRRFRGEVVADMLCYLRLHVELALRAKGMLLLRESGFAEQPLDDDTRAQIEELRYLERSLGKTGQLALRPLVLATSKDLWQLKWLAQ